MRVLFMGTPDLAACVLKRIIEDGHEVIGVVTQPDKQKGRGKAMSCPPVKEMAISYHLNVYQPIKVREAQYIEMIRKMNPEVIVVAAFGQILPKELLEIPKYGCINVHTSLLPKYRGAAPIQYCIINGEKETGVTIMHMDTSIDTGDIILQEKIKLSEKETGGSLHDKLAVLGADLLVKVLHQLENGTADRIKQEEDKATYVKVIQKEMGKIDFTRPAVEIERLIRGLNPWPSAYTSLEGKTLKLWSADVEASDHKAEPGEVIEVRKDAIAVMTGEGLLVLRELQLEGKKRMPADAFLRGYQLKVGTKLG